MLSANIPEDSIPTLNEALQTGGTQAFAPLFKNYLEINAKMRNHPALNHNLSLIDNQTPQILASAAENGFPTIMYLTTRPQSVEKITQDDLARLNLPTAPVLARPDNVDLIDTTKWKLETLVTVADRIPGTVVMIDDSLSLTRAITERNHPKLKPLLFQGPVTPTDHNEPSATWPTFIQSLQEIAASIS